MSTLRTTSLALVVLVGTTFAIGCTGQTSPTAPSKATQANVSADPVKASSEAPATPATSVLPSGGIGPSVIGFPPRNEPNAFFQDLTILYRDFLRRPQTSATFVDPEGENVWLTEYFRFYLNGCSHQEAMSRTLAELTSGGSQPVCGGETPAFPPRNLPNEFQGQLESTYRDVLRRPQILSYVDSEGANVWLAQYLRFRAGGCGHTEAENNVFTEIRGGGVQPLCAPLWSKSGTGNTVFFMPTSVRRVTIVGTYTGPSYGVTGFYVTINGPRVINQLLGPVTGQLRFEGTFNIGSGSGEVTITNSEGTVWSFTEVR